ncbi:MAG: ABC transporter permease subunit [Rhodospirillales bacterium]
MPLWCSYLARVYAWRLILSHDGALNWALNLLHLPDQKIAYTNWAIWLVFSYLWLPFMILPVAAALERISPTLLEASADLGASEFTTLRRVLLPLAIPGLVAGSIFTFSLTLAISSHPCSSAAPDPTLSATLSMPAWELPTTSRSPPRSPCCHYW